MYPNRVIPHHTMFARLHQRLGETGSFKKLTNGNGRPRTVSTPDVEEQVLQELEDSPTKKKSVMMASDSFLLNLNNHLESNSYIGGHSPTQEDVLILKNIPLKLPSSVPNVIRWSLHMLSFSSQEIASFQASTNNISKLQCVYKRPFSKFTQDFKCVNALFEDIFQFENFVMSPSC
ncbi:hypothetical protein Anas_06415 [Armadillidium nasatum]|uniref:Uncharacterized protein n=1 Tax=Armadillidium nasatum TaxID=96803 RepID=A0A5N5T5X2_9CRUS|nr:hypothetical protein Anas_06415 [Armadillidium nasatum]